ncbi:hypothetical protein HRG_010204 [Hirsutella rhossiliensis]|uniref:Uncharacterized protein n=1 Tax=Hirsutella rhossiliensis TaxID=111463 RepID=A0A9P8MNH6_9HYPO|nr:uncharacterized protein HRG_10204 [Hirsutella rhossiliensis]KAH0958517.1 hypothetical protein HRG_10204 [Hirsutella rhossiliensis]
MRHEMDLPAAYWEFSNATAAYLRNRGVVKEWLKAHGIWNPADKKVHEVRFVEFDESKYTDNEISQESQSQYDDEKEEKREQGELTDDDSDAEDSVRDRTMDQEATEAGDPRFDERPWHSKEQRSSEQSWNGGKEKNSAWQNV